MDAISLSIRELPTRYHGCPAIESRLWRRSEADEQEVLFSYRGPPRPALIPVIYQEEFRIVRWVMENATAAIYHPPASFTSMTYTSPPGSACSRGRGYPSPGPA